MHRFDTIYWDAFSIGRRCQKDIFSEQILQVETYLYVFLLEAVCLCNSIISTLVSLVIGITYGAIAGYIGGKVDSFMMRIVDILYALPFMFLVILLMVMFGRHIILIFVAIGAINF